MALSNYRSVLAVPAIRRALIFGVLVRIPMWAGSVVLTLHVVGHLNRSYADAGLFIAAATIATAISGPWRGRRLDQLGLRRSTWINIVVLTACWSVAPWVGYWMLIPVVFLAGMFVMPTFSILRQVLISQVPEEERKSTLVLDAVFVEASFMIGPLLGVLMAHSWGTQLALLAAELASTLGCLALWILNPPMGQDESTRDQHHPIRSWLTAPVLAILAASGAAVLVLTGTDLSIVAALRSLDKAALIGVMLAIWGLGSAVGGVVYGALTRHPPLMVLLGLLGATTALVAAAPGVIAFAVLLFLCGAFCAPTMTAAIDALTREVPVAVRGEAMGWHASAITSSSAISAPLVGIALDGGGWTAGFLAAGLAGVAIAVLGYWVAPRTGSPHVEDPALPTSEEIEARALGQA